MSSCDVIIVGSGAAGLMCAIEAGKRGRRVRLIDHAARIAEKIRISGGGRCNFTNIHAGPDRFISQNPHFCRSALTRYTPLDFMTMVRKHGIAFHEKTLGQLFCDGSSQQIIDMLLAENREHGIAPEMETKIASVGHDGGIFNVETTGGKISASVLVIASGGLSIPKIGASPFGYNIARQFGLDVVETKPALVPLTFTDAFLARCRALTGLSVEAETSVGRTLFKEGLLFTHRGLSGPSILQISSYWQEGMGIAINLVPQRDIFKFLKEERQARPKQDTLTALANILPRRLAQSIMEELGFGGRLADFSDKTLSILAATINRWHVRPAGSEGYRTAEVTRGGVDTKELSSQTMEAKKRPGLFFIGEVVDVTGHLGGFNFQWAWASGYAAGQYV